MCKLAALAISLLGGSIAGSARAQPPPQPTPVAHVQIDSILPAQLATEAGDEWRLVCDAPCDTNVPASLRYRIRGAGKPSAPFTLAGDRVVLRVTPGSTGTRTAGVVLIVVGAAAIPIGLIVAVASSIPTSGGVGPADPNRDSNVTGGLVLAGVGVAALITGVVLVIAADTRPGVQQLVPAARQAAARAPEWRTAGAFEAAAPRSFVVPALRVAS